MTLNEKNVENYNIQKVKSTEILNYDSDLTIKKEDTYDNL